ALVLDSPARMRAKKPFGSAAGCSAGSAGVCASPENSSAAAWRALWSWLPVAAGLSAALSSVAASAGAGGWAGAAPGASSPLRRIQPKRPLRPLLPSSLRSGSCCGCSGLSLEPNIDCHYLSLALAFGLLLGLLVEGWVILPRFRDARHHQEPTCIRPCAPC